jgi:hypothetical protein
MSSSFVIKVPPKRHNSENKWLRFQLLRWISFALLLAKVFSINTLQAIVRQIYGIISSLENDKLTVHDDVFTVICTDGAALPALFLQNDRFTV